MKKSKVVVPKLLIDSHEQKRIPLIKKLCNNWEWDYEVKQLRYGDYVCGNAVVEWKTITDFCSSIVDGRLKRESINQANHYPYHFVFVVGDLDKGLKLYNRYGNRKGGRVNFHYPQIWGAVASLVQYTQVLFIQDERKAFYQMKHIFEKCNQDKKRQVVPVDKLGINPCFNYLNSSHGVGKIVAENVTEQLKLNSLSDLLKVKEEDLLSVDLVGKGRAKAVMKAIWGEDYDK